MSIISWTPTAVHHTVTQLLDPGCFASWLRSQPGTRPLYDDDGKCVLAIYLHDQGFVHVTVSKNDCYVDGLDALGPVDLPRWARAFVLAIDRSGATYRDAVVKVFEQVMADAADREKPMAFEDWRESGKVVA